MHLLSACRELLSFLILAKPAQVAFGPDQKKSLPAGWVLCCLQISICQNEVGHFLLPFKLFLPAEFQEGPESIFYSTSVCLESWHTLPGQVTRQDHNMQHRWGGGSKSKRCWAKTVWCWRMVYTEVSYGGGL